MEIKELSLEEWGQYLPQSGFEVFHTPEALSVLDAHSEGDLKLLGGLKGESPVALLPVFVREMPVGRIILSPPPEMGVPRLGPLIMPNSPKRNKREAITRRFVEGVVDELDATEPLSILRFRCGIEFDDPRPFNWQEFRVEPSFTYVLDVDAPDIDSVLKSFSRSHRREFRYAGESDLEVTLEGKAAAERIISQVAERYEEHDDMGDVDWPYVRDLLDALPDRSRVYVVRDPAGNYLSGIVALVSNDSVYYWQGGVGIDYEDGEGRSISVNAAVHRAILEDILSDPELEDVDSYDLVGANTRRLCEYKSKFGGRLSPYYVIESDDASTKLAKAGYQLLARYR